MTGPTGAGRPAGRGVHPLEADAAGHRRLAAARRVRGRGAAARGRAADHRADDRRVRRRCPARRRAEVEQRVTRPIEKLLWEIPGVEYHLLHVQPGPGDGRRPLPGRRGRGARARAAEPEARRQRCDCCRPARRRRSSSRARSTTCRSWRSRSGAHATTTFGCGSSPAQLHDALKEVPDVSEVTIIGGRPRQVTRRARPGALAARQHRSARRCSGRSPRANARCDGRRHRQPAIAATLRRDRRLARDRSTTCGDVVVGDARRRAGASRATSRRSPTAAASPTSYVMQYPRARPRRSRRSRFASPSARAPTRSTLTRAVEREGRDAARLPAARAMCSSSVTRNYGETAREKSNELLWHMLLAVVSVVGS